MISKKSQLLSMVLSLGLLMGLTLSGCTDKDREVGPIPPTPTPDPVALADVYVDVSALELEYDSLYCKVNFPNVDVADTEESGEESEGGTQLEIDENGMALIAEQQEVGSTLSFALSFQLEGEEVAVYAAEPFIVSSDEDGRQIIVVDSVTPVDDGKIKVYADISEVQYVVGYHKVILKSGDKESELEFDEDGISTTPVAKVEAGEKAKFRLGFVQKQYDYDALKEGEEQELEVEIANYDASAEGVEVVAEDGQAIVVVEELVSSDNNCITVDPRNVTASYKFADGKVAKYAEIGLFYLNSYTATFVELRPLGTGFAPISINGLVELPEACYFDIYLHDSLNFDSRIAERYFDYYELAEGITNIEVSDDDFCDL